MERDPHGRICLDDSEADVIRAALFVAAHHLDSVAGHCSDCFHTITGVRQDAIAPTLDALDELNGNRAKHDKWLTGELARKAAMSDSDLRALPERVRESFVHLISQAKSRGIEVPQDFESRLRRTSRSD